MEPYHWEHLSPLQLGRYAEYFVKMELTRHGFDIYTSEVDDRGIDFVIRKDAATYYDVQVKSVRNWNYIFFSKDKFKLRRNLLAVVAIFVENEPPHLFMIPATAWQKPNALLVDRDYAGKKSKPEWGLNSSQKNRQLLNQFSLETMIHNL